MKRVAEGHFVLTLSGIIGPVVLGPANWSLVQKNTQIEQAMVIPGRFRAKECAFPGCEGTVDIVEGINRVW